MTNPTEREQAAAALIQVAPRLSRLIERELATSGNPLSLRQLRVLQRLADGEQIAAEIARYSSVGPAAMQGVLDGLVDRGFVLRERSKEDRRKQLLTLTTDGRAALADGNATISAALMSLIGGLKLSDQEKIAKALNALDAAIDQRIAANRAQAVAGTQ